MEILVIKWNSCLGIIREFERIRNNIFIEYVFL